MMREIVSLQASSEKESKIKILDHKHAKGTAKNSQDNKALRHKVKTLPTTVLTGKSPYELVYKCEPNLLHLKTFGCLCFSTVLNESDKFGSRGDSADVGKEFIPNKSTSKSRDSIVDDAVRTNYYAQTKTLVLESEKDSVDVTYSTSSRKGNRHEEYATETSGPEGIHEYATETPVSEGIPSTSLNDDEYMSEGEDLESFDKMFGWSPKLTAVKDSRWVDAMNQEMEALNRNKTWEVVKLPNNRRDIRSKWVFKVKYKASGDVERLKLDVL
nr:putative reverse transcriptase, RNA-dependent DNA polymerase, Gag-polypeptide of LTR copia-type [Tanacetum cinerariifolium]